MKRGLSLFIALLLAPFIVGVASGQTFEVDVDTSTSTFKSDFTTTNDSGSATTNFITAHGISGQSLSDSGFIDTDTLNAALVDFESDSVASQPPGLLQNIDGAVADDGGAQTTETTEATNSSVGDVTLLPATAVANDAYYFGADYPYRLLYISISQAGDGDWALEWEFWNGSAWADLVSVEDNTNSFETAGLNIVSWRMPDDWAETSVNALTHYWVRARVESVTTTTTQPLATQVWFENGVYYSFIPSIGDFEQVDHDLYLGGSTDLVTNQQFFPGDDGYIVTDDASLENASSYLIRLEGYIETDATAPGTADILNKTSAIRIYNSADGTIRAQLNGVTNLDVTGVEDGHYVMDLYDDGSNVTFTIYGVGSATNATVSITDNANNWEFGTEGAVYYFDSIIIGNPLVFLDTTTAEFDARTNVDTDGVSDELTLASADAWQTTCNGLQDTPTDWTAICGSSTSLGWELGSALGIGAAAEGSNVYGLASSGSNNVEFSIYHQIAGTAGLDYSFAADCWRIETPVVVLRIEFLDASFVQLSVDDNTSGTCNGGSWNEWAVNSSTAPASTAWVRFHLMSNTTTSSTTKGKDVYWDNARACEDCAAAPVSQAAAGQVIGNGSFEAVNASSGTSTSTAMDVTSITSYISSSINWSETTPGDTSITVEFSTDDGSNWTTVSNGDSIPGLTSGDDLSGASNYRTRITLDIGTGTVSPTVEDIAVSVIGTGAALDGWWEPNEIITTSLSDRSSNSNTAAASFPLPTDDSDFAFLVSSFESTGVSTAVNASTSNPEIVDPQGFIDETTDSDLSDIPIFGDIVGFITNSTGYPEETVWGGIVLLFTTIAGALGMMLFKGSVMAAIGSMIFTLLFFVNVGTGGVIPNSIFLMAAFGAVGYALWQDRRSTV